MAKSVGNIFLLREVLDRYEPRRWCSRTSSPRTTAARWSSRTEKLDEAKAAYERLADAFGRPGLPHRRRRPGAAPWASAPACGAARRARPASAFAEHMDDDLNTAGAIGELFALVGDVLPAIWRGRPRRGAARRRRRWARRVQVLRESLEMCCSCRCRPRGRGEPAASVPGRRGLRHRRRALLPAPSAWPRRAAGTTSSSSTRERLALRRPLATPACCATTTAPRRTGPGRPAARRAAGGRFRGARHQAGTQVVRTGAAAVRGTAQRTMEWIYGRKSCAWRWLPARGGGPTGWPATAPALACAGSCGRPAGCRSSVVAAHELDGSPAAATTRASPLQVETLSLRRRRGRAARPDLVVVLDEVSDPRNLGAVARSALASGAGGLVAAAPPLGRGHAGGRQGLRRRHRASADRPGDQHRRLSQARPSAPASGSTAPPARRARSYLDLDYTARWSSSSAPRAAACAAGGAHLRRAGGDPHGGRRGESQRERGGGAVPLRGAPPASRARRRPARPATVNRHALHRRRLQRAARAVPAARQGRDLRAAATGWPTGSPSFAALQGATSVLVFDGHGRAELELHAGQGAQWRSASPAARSRPTRSSPGASPSSRPTSPSSSSQPTRRCSARPRAPACSRMTPRELGAELISETGQALDSSREASRMRSRLEDKVDPETLRKLEDLRNKAQTPGAVYVSGLCRGIERRWGQ